MYLCYDEAVQVGLNAYRTLEYAGSCRSAFRVALGISKNIWKISVFRIPLSFPDNGLMTVKNTGITTNSKVQEKR